MDNLDLFKYCFDKREKFFDKNYMFTEEDKSLKLFIKKTKEIKETLTAIKKIKEKKNNEKILSELFDDLQESLKENANYSEFGCFINACDSNINTTQKDRKVLEEITKLYLKKRKISDIAPEEWVQAIIDKGSSKKKGHAGENKLMDILIDNKYKLVNRIDQFKNEKKCFARFSKNGEFSNKNIKKHLGISIGKNTQNKVLDILIKKEENIFFLEAKHLNTSGGEQNKQILELIDLIKKDSGKKECHFISFLDGIYSNELLSKKNEAGSKDRNKITKQYNDILKALKNRKNNYWVNTAGFIKMFS